MIRDGHGAGHGGEDPGAVSQGNIERDIARVMNNALVFAGQSTGWEIVNLTVNKGYPYNIDEPVYIANASGVRYAFQNHFNAGGGTGVEVIYYQSDQAGYEIATRISAAISSAYGLRNRGAKPSTRLGFLNGTDMTAFIIEWGFVDAPGNSDCPKILANPEAGANAVIRALGGNPVVALGTNIQLFQSNSSAAQQWERIAVKKVGNHQYYKYKNRGTGKCFDCRDGGKTQGTQVWAFPDNGTDAQLFREELYTYDTDQRIILHPLLNDNLVLDVRDGSHANGALIQLFAPNGTPAQSFSRVFAAPGPFYYYVNQGSGKPLDVKDGR